MICTAFKQFKLYIIHHIDTSVYMFYVFCFWEATVSSLSHSNLHSVQRRGTGSCHVFDFHSFSSERHIKLIRVNNLGALLSRGSAGLAWLCAGDTDGAVIPTPTGRMGCRGAVRFTKGGRTLNWSECTGGRRGLHFRQTIWIFVCVFYVAMTVICPWLTTHFNLLLWKRLGNFSTEHLLSTKPIKWDKRENKLLF